LIDFFYFFSKFLQRSYIKGKGFVFRLRKTN